VDVFFVAGCESGLGMTVLLLLLLVVVVFLAITPRAGGWLRLAGGL
jgi:hypothetical protein